MKDILKNNEEELYKVCEEIDIYNDVDILCEVTEVFRSTCEKTGKCIGVGLAANQIGYTKRFIVVSESGNKKDIIALINPTIIRHGKEVTYEEERCLSYPDRKEQVGRYRVIDVEYLDDCYQKVKKTFKGFIARIIQHEIDHLNGLDCLTNRL